MKKEMHGFTAFCLGALLFFCVILIIVSLINPNLITSSNLSSKYGIFFYVVGIISCILLLKFNVIGFWLSVISGIVDILLHLSSEEEFIITLFANLIGIAILFGILRLKKNGVSTWEYLTNPFKRGSSNNVTNAAKRCRKCEKVFSFSINNCPHCGSSFYEETNQAIDSNVLSNIPINRNYNETWVCKKCNEGNPITSPTCKGCGEYK